jgi:chorismate mutase
MTAMIDIPSSILSAPTDATAGGNGNAADAAGRTPDAATTGASGPAVENITGLRERIDEIDDAIIQLWQERAAISAEVGRVRIASGGTRLVLSREREIVDRFRDALGADGVQLALLILRAGRGPL